MSKESRSTRTQARLWSLGLMFALAACGDSTDDPQGESQGARIYATISGSDEVAVIDDETHRVLKTIPVGEGPAILLNSPDFTKLYSANWKDNTVSVIDTESDKVTSIPVAERPYVIALAPDGSKLYAGLNNNQIAVIDTANNTVVQSFETKELPASIIVSPDGQTLYVATIGLGVGTLRAVSASDGSVTKLPIDVGGAPAWITIGKDGSKVYTLNFLSDDVGVVDTASFTLEKTLATGTGSMGIIGNVTPDGERLYVTNYGTHELIGIDTKTHEIVQTIPIDGRPVGINFDQAGTRLYVTDFGPKSLEENPVSGSEFLLSGDYKATYAGQVSVYDRSTGDQIGDTIEVGPGATSVVVVPPK